MACATPLERLRVGFGRGVARRELLLDTARNFKIRCVLDCARFGKGGCDGGLIPYDFVLVPWMRNMEWMSFFCLSCWYCF